MYCCEYCERWFKAHTEWQTHQGECRARINQLAIEKHWQHKWAEEQHAPATTQSEPFLEYICNQIRELNEKMDTILRQNEQILSGRE